ncbi:head completion/stabilization protein [Sphingomonas sp. NFR15]|uniref:head completion/stabilization protein n=1 Tax=Sphingomonas sp. NFR15 TaxID=1566282 RepID=UPI0008867E9C|nr:head completion/stabilization protein [Sphingomonas sp. NFR15]SDA21517.1 Phage head completion protein (GPL) [Sphingomonas sp. NFR15]
MSGFNCTPSIVPPASTVIEAPIANDGWFPDIDLASLREAMRLRDSVTPARLRTSALDAIITVGNQLVAWQARQVAAGYASLGAVPAPILDGKSRLVLLYARAIGAYTKAELVERYRDVDQTAAGQRSVGELDSSIEELRRDGLHAVRDMLGTTRVFVELI